MTEAGRLATDSTRKLMQDVRKENRESLIDLVASDKNCQLGYLGKGPVIAFGNPVGQSKLCRVGGTVSGDFEFVRFKNTAFAPSLAVIDGFVAYFDAVDAIVSREPLDFSGGFDKAEGELRGIASDLAIIGGADASGIPALSDDQRKAVSGILDLMSELVDEANRVDDLRKIELDLDQVAIEGSLTSLENANDRWVRALDAQIDNRLLLANRELPKIKDYDRRRIAVDAQLTLIERKEALPALKVALRETTVALRKARTDYRNLLFNVDRTLTPAERKKAASITRARLRAALASLASVISAF